MVPQSIKNPSAVQETQVQSLGPEDPLEKEMATHSSILAWQIPRAEEAGRLYSPWGCKELDVTEGLSLPLSSVIFLKHLKTSSLPSLVFQLLAAIILAWILESPLYQHKMVVSQITKVQFSSVAQSCPTLCNPVDCSTPDFPVHHQLPELAQSHVYRVSDPIQHLILCSPLLLPPTIFPSI